MTWEVDAAGAMLLVLLAGALLLGRFGRRK